MSGFRAIRKTAILYLDVEGGWGGSSRSLYYLVEALDRERYEPVVLLRKPGPVESRYEALGVTCHVIPEMATFRPADRKNAVAFAIFLLRLRYYLRLIRRIAPIVTRHKIALIHVNHESMASTGALLARHFGLPWIGHVRTLLTPGLFARRVHRMMAQRAAFIIFITEPNRAHFRALAGRAFDAARTDVIHNIIPLAETEPDPLPALSEPPERFRVLSLTNFAPSRGVDRIIDVAAELQARGEAHFAFYLCGHASQTSVLTGRADPYYENLVARVRRLGLDDMVFFTGHITEPERALAASDSLIKLTRQANPWGRDIIEAMAAGVPVLTLGTFEDFIENRVNGFIDAEFDAARMADHLGELAASEAMRRAMRSASRDKAKRLFNGPYRARDVAAVYRRVIGPSAQA